MLAVVVVVRFCQFEFLERLERYTYDLRARAALHFPSPAATNLAFVEIAESSLVAVQNNPELDFHHASFPWPRHIYGRLVHELTAEGVKAVAFDILYGELHPDHDPVLLPDGQLMMRESARCCVMTKKRTVTLSLLYAVRRALHCAHPFAAIQFRRKKELSMKKTIQERHPAVAKVLNDLREGRNTFSIFAR